MVVLLYIISFSGFGGFFLFYLNSILKISFKASKKELFFGNKEKILYLFSLILFLVLLFVSKEIGKVSILLSGILTIIGILVLVINLKELKEKKILREKEFTIFSIGIIINIVANLNGMIVRGSIFPLIALAYWILSVIIIENKIYNTILKLYWVFMFLIVGLFKITNGKKIIGTIGQTVISVGEIIGRKVLNKTVVTLMIPIIMVVFIITIEYVKKKKGKYGNKNI